MKKIIIFAMLISIIVTMFTGCSNDASQTEEPQNKETETKPVVELDPHAFITDADGRFVNNTTKENILNNTDLIAVNYYFRNITNEDMKNAIVKASGMSENILDRYTVTIALNDKSGYDFYIEKIMDILNIELETARKNRDYKKMSEIISLIIVEQDRNFSSVEIK